LVSVLHHQPPQQPLVWQGMFALMQPVHIAGTLGPRRAPQTPPLELVLVVELEVVVEAEVVVLELEVVLELVVEPQTLVFGTHAASCLPSASATGVHVRSDVQILVPPHEGAQYWSPPNWAHTQPMAQSESWRQGAQAAGAPPVPPEDEDVTPPVPAVLVDVVWPPVPAGPLPVDALVVCPPCDWVDDEELVPVLPPLVPHATRATIGVPKRRMLRTCFMSDANLSQRARRLAERGGSGSSPLC
jgi:hypothetical protein